MPVYEYRCDTCQRVTERTCSVAHMKTSVRCGHCGARKTHRVVSRTSVRLSSTSKAERLDPKYDRMVDQAMRNTSNADPDRLLKKMRPFSDASD